jgi:hydroxyacylglutathione hydrolase
MRVLQSLLGEDNASVWSLFERNAMLKTLVLNTLLDNFTYVIHRENRAVVVDPSEAGPVLRLLDATGLTLAGIINTHGHFDHVAGNDELVKRTGCGLVGLADYSALNDGTGDSLLCIAGLDFRVLSTPGHSEDSLSFFLGAADGSAPMVFTGDTLFGGGCGRLFTHSPEMMWSSLVRLAGLPPETEVYCGHDYSLEDLEFALDLEPDNEAVKARLEQIRSLVEAGQATVPSTIALELASNPFLRANDPALRKVLGMEHSSDVEVFAEVRRRKDRF